MTRKTPTGAYRDSLGRWRRPDGRFASKASIVALKGWQTRRREAAAKARDRAARVAAAKHGRQAREKTERRLSAAQVEARRREARRVAQKVRRAKKERRAPEPRGRLSRSKTSRSSKGRSKKSTSKRPRSTKQITIGEGDQFAAQIRVRFDMPEGFTPTNALVKAAILHRIREGEDAPRAHTKILRWRNPGRRAGEDRAWRQGNQGDAWLTLGNVIAAAVS